MRLLNSYFNYFFDKPKYDKGPLIYHIIMQFEHDNTIQANLYLVQSKKGTHLFRDKTILWITVIVDTLQHNKSTE